MEVPMTWGVATQQNSELLTKTELQYYMKIFPEILEKVVENSLNTHSKTSDMSQMTEWMSKVVRYNISCEPRHLGGILVPAAYKSIVNNDTDEESFKLAHIMGWGLEICHGAKLMADNIMDQKCSLNIDVEKPAWHTIEHVGMTAVNDNFILKVANYNILKIFFADKPYYYQLQDSARDGYQKMVLGRALWEQMEKGNNFADSYSLKRYRQVVRLMLSYYKFYMPVESALIMTGILGVELELQIALKELMLLIGYYNQLKVDFENTFGLKKEWFDRANGKMRRLTWFFAKSLELASKEQAEKIMELTNDEIGNKKAGDKLRKHYINVGLIKEFQQEKAEVYVEIQNKMANLPKLRNISLQFFSSILMEIENQCLQ